MRLKKYCKSHQELFLFAKIFHFFRQYWNNLAWWDQLVWKERKKFSELYKICQNVCFWNWKNLFQLSSNKKKSWYFIFIFKKLIWRLKSKPLWEEVPSLLFELEQDIIFYSVACGLNFQQENEFSKRNLKLENAYIVFSLEKLGKSKYKNDI